MGIAGHNKRRQKQSTRRKEKVKRWDDEEEDEDVIAAGYIVGERHRPQKVDAAVTVRCSPVKAPGTSRPSTANPN